MQHNYGLQMTNWLESRILLLLGNHFKVFFQRGRKYHDEHLQEIKEKVIAPLQEKVSGYIVPVLKHERSNLYSDFEQVYSEVTSISKPSWVLGNRREIKVSSERFFNPHGYKYNAVLYKDILEFHRLKEIKRFTEFENRFYEFGGCCLNYANQIKTVLLEKSELPEGYGNNSEKRWIDANDLSLFIFEKQFGMNPTNYLNDRMSTNGFRELYRENINHIYVQLEGHEFEKIQSIKDLCNKLLSDNPEIERLRLNANDLLKNALTLVEDFERFQRSFKLSGRCSYITNSDYWIAFLVLVGAVGVGMALDRYMIPKLNTLFINWKLF